LIDPLRLVPSRSTGSGEKSRSIGFGAGRAIMQIDEDDTTYPIFSNAIYPQIDKVIVTTNSMRAQSASTDGWTRVNPLQRTLRQ
jgi:hypothetical protein